MYGESGSPIGIELNGTQYYYIKNVQGDIVGIVDTSGNKVVEYNYNSWGYLRYTTGSMASTLGAKNHLRYRGYYYDTDMGLYYLMSRYYDPRTGRFINADDTVYIGADSSFVSYNMFAYCGNNPINYLDSAGFARKKISTTQYNNKFWLEKFVSKYIPNIYSGDLITKTLYNRSFLGVRIKICVSVAAQTNANSIFGGMFKRGTIEVSAIAGINDKLSFAFSPGVTWKNIYFKLGLAYSPRNSGLFYALSLELSVSHITSAVLVACCAAMPYMSTFIASTITAINASIKSAAAILIPLIPKFVTSFA